MSKLRNPANAPPGGLGALGQLGTGLGGNLDPQSSSELATRASKPPDAARYMVSKTQLDVQKSLTSHGSRGLVDRSRTPKEGPTFQQSQSPPRPQLEPPQERGHLYSQEILRRASLKNAHGFLSTSAGFTKGSLAANLPTHPSTYTAQAGHRAANQRFISQTPMQPLFGRPGTVSQQSSFPFQPSGNSHENFSTSGQFMNIQGAGADFLGGAPGPMQPIVPPLFPPAGVGSLTNLNQPRSTTSHMPTEASYKLQANQVMMFGGKASG